MDLLTDLNFRGQIYQNTDPEGLAERLRQKAHVRLLTFGRGVDTVTTLPTSSSNDESKLGPSENREPEPSNDGNSEKPGGLKSLDALASEWKANRSESALSRTGSTPP